MEVMLMMLDWVFLLANQSFLKCTFSGLYVLVQACWPSGFLNW